MPFIALQRETGARIDITTLPSPRQALNAKDCICQLCNAPMIIKAGLIKRAHFAHANACDTHYQSHPESPEHRAAKMFLKEQLPQRYTDYKNVRLEYEVPIKEVGRIVDLLAIFPQGHRVAHEVQLASITTEQLEERTRDYERAGIDVVWWFGRSAFTPANRDWCLRTFGIVFYLYPKDIQESVTQPR